MHTESRERLLEKKKACGGFLKIFLAGTASYGLFCWSTPTDIDGMLSRGFFWALITVGFLLTVDAYYNYHRELKSGGCKKV